MRKVRAEDVGMSDVMDANERKFNFQCSLLSNFDYFFIPLSSAS